MRRLFNLTYFEQNTSKILYFFQKILLSCWNSQIFTAVLSKWWQISAGYKIYESLNRKKQHFQTSYYWQKKSKIWGKILGLPYLKVLHCCPVINFLNYDNYYFFLFLITILLNPILWHVFIQQINFIYVFISAESNKYLLE